MFHAQKNHKNQKNIDNNISSQQKIFAIHGGGNIGLGLMADIISKSNISKDEQKYKIIATSSDEFTNNLINAKKQLTLQHANGEETTINNVEMVYSRHSQNINNLYTHADLLAICLTEEGFLHSANTLAKALITRYNMNNKTLKILILMNKPNCDHFVKAEIHKQLLNETQHEYLAETILSGVQFVPTVVDRIVSKIKSELVIADLKNQLIRRAGVKFTSHHSFTNHLDEIFKNPKELANTIQGFDLQIKLFNAEKNFVLYVPNDFTESVHFPTIKPVKNLQTFMAVKNKFINGPHAMLAWMGALKGYKTIAQAIKDPEILKFIKKAMEKEIAPILRAAYSEITLQELEYLENAFIQRCLESKEDTVTRVGRDPLRKLNLGNCIRGVIELKEKLGLKFSTTCLERGFAAGILYAIKRIDPNNNECNKIYEIFKQNRSYQSVLCYDGHHNSGKYSGLHAVKDKNLLKNILWQIFSFEKNKEHVYSYQLSDSKNLGRSYSHNDSPENSPALSPLKLPEMSESLLRSQTFFGHKNQYKNNYTAGEITCSNHLASLKREW